MSGGKGGGGGGSAPNVNIPGGLYQGAASETGLAQYGTSLFNPIASLTNWAANQAGGGNAPQIPSFESQASVAGPSTVFPGGPKPWETSFDPVTGMVNFTNPGNPQQQFQAPITDYLNNSGQQNEGAFGDIPAATLQQWSNDYNANRAGGGIAGASGGSGSSGQNQFLTQAEQAIAQIPGLEQTTQAFTTEQQQEADTLFGQGQTLFQEATTGSGLFPSQQAMVNQAVASQKAGIATELGAAGLSESSAAPILSGEADQQGAATAGQLVQGNITAAQNQVQLAQAASKLALGGQELSLGEQAAMEQESAGLQQQLWTEAMQGYGVLGSMISQVAGTYGYSIQAYNSVLQGEEANASLQEQASQAAAQSANAANSSLGSGLGSLLGGGGSGGGGLGGLFSGIGSLFGAGGGIAAGGAAAAAGSGALASGATGIGLDAVVTAVGAAF